ncbi:hypothetical protein CFBP4996_15430 [Agrobacterium leguminum]|uniref:Uncharacterized protein n=1 Tax=Agrobacterium deltaense NCPPB 1641 TaxID=1183425 RepID=A0A1S7U2C2_9HYPH|nr:MULTISPECIES: hypothetical protein [Agrobacterium]WFS67419.1 hypothetical protein CFBP4996_15430 [Agrobacterium leguminum]CVI60989.1 hypothetical protein AGR7A_Lc140048 [Agrobacterium deltaense NCPPB 1641]
MPYSKPKLSAKNTREIIKIVKDVQSGKIENYETLNKDGKLHSFDDLPSLIHMSDYTSGENDKSITFDWHKDGTLHRDNGPASITINKQAEIMFYWWRNGIRAGQFVCCLPNTDGFFVPHNNTVYTYWTIGNAVSPAMTCYLPAHIGIRMVADLVPIPVQFPKMPKRMFTLPITVQGGTFKNVAEWAEDFLEKSKEQSLKAA